MINPFNRRGLRAHALERAWRAQYEAAQRAVTQPPPTTEHEPAPPPPDPQWSEASRGVLLSKLTYSQHLVRTLKDMVETARQRADTAEAALAADTSAAAMAELRRELAEARTENAALRSAHSRDRERIREYETRLERARGAEIAREREHGLGHFEGRERPEWRDASAPKPVEIPSEGWDRLCAAAAAAARDTPTPPITDRSRADGGTEQPRTEEP